jgi:hypothetical protein
MLTKRQIEVLQQMAQAYQEERWGDAAITSEGLEVWLGFERSSWRTLRAFLDHCAVSGEGGIHGSSGYRIWTINSVGLLIARRPELADTIWLRLRSGKPFTISADGIGELEELT